jgi:hypothetical protein
MFVSIVTTDQPQMGIEPTPETQCFKLYHHGTGRGCKSSAGVGLAAEI